jgi:hypothetical protein
MKITKENTHFIDNYLKNSKIDFFDIRIEMLDHVATAVENKMQLEDLDFYDAFKSYMVLNKKDLLERNEKLMKWSFSNALPFLKFCTKPLSIFIAIVVFVIYQYFDIFLNTISSNLFLGIIIILVITIVFIQLFLYHFILKDRFFAVEKSSFVLMLIYQISNFCLNSYRDQDLPFLLFYIPSIFTILYIIFYVKEVFNQKKFYLT